MTALLNPQIDARSKHKPELAVSLINTAIKLTDSRAEVARRCGCSDEYLRLLLKGKRVMSYGLQVTLESLVSDAEKD